MARLTLKNIAEMAGVDKSVVSKVVNGVEKVPACKEKVERVRSIIKKYNYVPLGPAQSLATNRTSQVAFLLSSTTEALYANPAYGQIFSGVIKACRRHHYQCQAEICDFSDIRRFAVPENMMKRSIDGCILGGHISDAAFEKIAEVDIPMVVLGGEYISDKVPAITWDSLQELKRLFKLFTELGHNYIWFSDNSANIRGRLKQLLPQYKRLQIEMFGETGRDEIEHGRIYAERFAKLPPAGRPTLVRGCDQFCCSFIGTLAKSGLHCPADVSVLCSSETEMAACFNPPLSTFSMDFFEMGRRGGELMLKILKNKWSLSEMIDQAAGYVLEGKYTDRGSIRRCRAY